MRLISNLIGERSSSAGSMGWVNELLLKFNTEILMCRRGEAYVYFESVAQKWLQILRLVGSP